MREDTVQSILTHKLIVIARGVPNDAIVRTADALVKGGVRLMEITFDAANRARNTETAEAIRLLKREFGDDLCVGAGTVLSEEQLNMAKQAGAEYIISPDANASIIRLTRKLDMVSIPGAFTPTEIQAAHLAGADFVKVFPICAVDASYLKAVSAPLSHIRLLAVGNVNEQNFGEYLAAGACGVGVGGKLVDRKCIAEGRFSELTALARRFTEQL